MLRPILKSAVEYGRDAVGAMIAFLLGAVFTLGSLALDVLGFEIPTRPLVVGGILLMVAGQFWAYHKLRLRHVETEVQLEAARGLKPEIDARLERLEEFPGLRPPDSEAASMDVEALGLGPEPDHMDTVRLRVKAEIDPPLLDIQCTAPIYSALCIFHLPDELVMTIEPVLREPDRVLMQLGTKPLPAGTGILLKLFSPVPLRVKRIAIGRRR